MKLSHIVFTALLSTAAATSFANTTQTQPTAPTAPNAPVIVSTDESVETTTLGSATTQAPNTTTTTPSPTEDTGASEIKPQTKSK